jgi:lipoate-protein ligase A
MELLDLTLATPAENIALDEALLDEADAGGVPRETLRLWEPARELVVVGRSSLVEQEVRLASCRKEGVPILRRASGGAAIVTGPGCLMYAVVLSYELHPGLRMLDQAHRFVLERVRAAIEPLLADGDRSGIELCGTSDLALAGRKFSGNSLRCKREHLLYHGTLLVSYPVERIGQLLGTAPRQPEYRAARSHGEFVTQLPIALADLRRSLASAWQASDIRRDWPRAAVQSLVAERYSRDAWNFER